jgi:UDP-2,4-diacetamido-2,4,6-trideoxy-beta-L-altropyranose hydrolase
MSRIVFRVDSGYHIGVGHVMRCLTLAQKLKEKNHDIYFLTNNHAGNINSVIEKDFKIELISGGLQKALEESEKLNYKSWIGESLEEDLKKTNAFIERVDGCEIFIVDHYAVDSDYEKKINAKKIIVVDDLANRRHYCDILIDQNITADEKNYSSLLDKESRLLMGPSFALLRDEFKSLRTKVNPQLFNRATQSILIFFGGADVEGLTLKFVSMVSEFLDQYNFHFVLNKTHRDFVTLNKILKSYPNCTLHSFVENFGELMLKMDLFIGAGGTTSWERASLGVASALVAVAENQMGNCRRLHETENCYFIGRSCDLRAEDWLKFFTQIVPNESLWYRFRKNSFALVDALGASKVTDEIEKVLC